MNFLTDEACELLCGGAGLSVVNLTTVGSPQVNVAPRLSVNTVNQLNNAVLTSVFAGVNSNYSSAIVAQQMNGLILP